MRRILQALFDPCNQSTKESGLKEFADMGISHDFFDYIFRLSFLRKQVPLRGWHLDEANNILASLQGWVPPQIAARPATCPWAQSSQSLVEMARMYHIGCLILVAKVLDASLKASHSSMRGYVHRGIFLVKAIEKGRFQRASVLIWPLFMIGTAAITSSERDTIQRAFRHLLDEKGIGCVRQIIKVLEEAWGFLSDDEANLIGLDVIFNDRLLGQILF